MTPKALNTCYNFPIYIKNDPQVFHILVIGIKHQNIPQNSLRKLNEHIDLNFH